MEQEKSRLEQEFQKREKGQLVRLNKIHQRVRSLLQKGGGPADRGRSCPGRWISGCVRSEGFGKTGGSGGWKAHFERRRNGASGGK